ncbi:hypothetical protein SAMN05660242_1600 [Thermoanaerobacterium sp. RBIITD]|nr:hypothetical protein SAMN05660242_1600 [Thermoanaerobacterium sp. RBIITD]
MTIAEISKQLVVKKEVIKKPCHDKLQNKGLQKYNFKKII